MDELIFPHAHQSPAKSHPCWLERVFCAAMILLSPSRIGEIVTDMGSILSHPGFLKALKGFSHPDPLHSFQHVFLAIRWDEERGGFADNLIGSIAIELLCAAIPTGNHAFQGSVSLKIASPEDSTMDASRCMASSACLRSVISFEETTTNSTSPSSSTIGFATNSNHLIPMATGKSISSMTV